MEDIKRPTNQRELDNSEAAGFWKAIALVNELSKNRDSATDVATLCQIHRTIFVDAFPEIAGKFRVAGEDTKKLHHLIPPPGSAVAGLIVEFSKELDARTASLPPMPRTKRKETYRKWVHKVVTVAAWAQHKIVAIHPFSNGNGRTARLFTNLILQKHGLTGSRIKFEQEDKNAYLNALAQIDKIWDYEPLIQIILRAIQDQYRLIIETKKAYLRTHKT